MATPGRDKQEVSLEVGARGKAKVSPSTLLQRRVPQPTRRGGGGIEHKGAVLTR